MKIGIFKHTQMKPRLLKQYGLIIIMLLACNSIFAQLQITTQTPNDGLEVGNKTGVFRFVANNPTGSPITVNQVNFVNFRGVNILDNPSGIITLNGNTYNTNLSNNIFTGPVTINAYSSLIIDYTAKAGCESIHAIGETVQNSVTVAYANGQTQTVQTNSYAIKWASISVPSTQINVQNQTDYNLIIPIKNAVGAGGASQIRYTITFPNDAIPLSQWKL